MTGQVPGEFIEVFSEENDGHRLLIVEPATQDWLTAVANLYRELRTSALMKPDPSLFADVDVVDMDQVRHRVLRTQIPPRIGGNFDVVRSDLAEVLMGYLGEFRDGFRYGYRSVRDRELPDRPGRGIDQIGVKEGLDENGNEIVIVMIGEAKSSAHTSVPPAVVDKKVDALRHQHLDHVKDLEKLVAKITSATRGADQFTYLLMNVALAHLEREDWTRLQLRAVCLMVRPLPMGVVDDFGSFRTSPEDYSPAKVDFVIVRTDAADLEDTVTKFHALASTDPNDTTEATDD